MNPKLVLWLPPHVPAPSGMGMAVPHPDPRRECWGVCIDPPATSEEWPHWPGWVDNYPTALRVLAKVLVDADNQHADTLGAHKNNSTILSAVLNPFEGTQWNGHALSKDQGCSWTLEVFFYHVDWYWSATYDFYVNTDNVHSTGMDPVNTYFPEYEYAVVPKLADVPAPTNTEPNLRHREADLRQRRALQAIWEALVAPKEG